MGIFDFLAAKKRVGRPSLVPQRDTQAYANLVQVGRVNQINNLIYKPTPRNLRYFSRTPYPRRAINAIKNPIKHLEWEIVPIDGIDWNSELKRQAEVATTCFLHPNEADDFQSLVEQLIEDYMIGALACETQISGDKKRPLWMWPVDGLTIQIYPEWKGGKDENHYAQTQGYGSAFGGGEIRKLADKELLYARPNQNTATPFGYGPLEIAFDSIARLLSVEKFAGNVAGNQRPSIGIDMPGIKPADLEAYRAFWQNDVEGQGKVPFFSSSMTNDGKTPGMQVLRFYPEGDNGLYLKYQEMLIREIGSAFDLSPQNFGLERDVNRDTSEVAQDRDWRQAIRPVARDVARAFTRHCLHKLLGFSQLQFRFVGMDREDEMAIVRILKERYETNSITPNQICERFGEPPIGGVWGDLTVLDGQIALWASRGAKEVDDPSLPKPKNTPAPAPKKKPASSNSAKGS